jgi:hypothetical protein
MTWDEGLRYIAAERSQRSMREDAIKTSSTIRNPPTMPPPFDGRMSGLSSSFDEFLTDHEAQPKHAAPDAEPLPASSSARRSVAKDPVTFEEWMARAHDLNLYELSNPAERRLIRRRLQHPECRVRQTIAEEPAAAVLLGMVVAVALGIAIGLRIGTSLRPTFRGGKRELTRMTQDNPFRCTGPATSAQKNTVEKILSFLN